MIFYDLIHQFKTHNLRLFIGRITGERIDLTASNNNDHKKVFMHVSIVEVEREIFIYDIVLKLNEEIVVEKFFIEQEEYSYLLDETFKRIRTFYKSK